VVRLQVEALEGRALMSAVAPVPPTSPPTGVAFAPPTGSNHGNFAGDGFGLNGMFASASRPAVPTNGIIAILIGL
jgi:hypothetical protein